MSTPADRLPDPPLLTQFPLSVAMRRLAPGDARATSEQRAAYLRRYTRLGDPEADAVVAMVQRLPTGTGHQLVETALEYGIDAVPDPPEELRALISQVDDVPYWVDGDQLDLACRVIGRTGLVGVTALAMLALCGGYLASRPAHTLACTGELEHRAPRRLADTMAWWTEVTTPGGMQRFGAGTKSTVRVRLTHAMVRAGLSRRPDWDYTTWDSPLNQSQLCGTILLFPLAQLTGSQACGIHFTPDERQAVYALWRYVGYLLGVRSELLPASERDAWRMWWLQADYEFRTPSEDSRRLAQALIHALGPTMTGPGTSRLHHLRRSCTTDILCAYARLLLGDHHADLLGLPNQKLAQATVIAAATAITTLEIPRRLLPGATHWCEIVGRRSQRAAANRMITKSKRKSGSTVVDTTR
ncbi:oxygenase MpaB family protein [Nocardia terpenica]|uniref:DUF2236 domain-containing protein n=1 Tax=Nocardia terpenica TaxID=455432 RepID=A0A6G9ZDN6_9NOCA|nr:oxygenase MpaB family protein [Nocardia terpenica]QIS23622.1 DUF2236 domain-containing protein [Nocardia terpenica]